ncbi:MAG: FtsQ-type POTRA domain-containing protein [Puniceicoccales bacterium]|jgi:hypothetical protein|nr:FtsQ-type POTRA domain-containing protein [Puniceicoccales bacterium]
MMRKSAGHPVPKRIAVVLLFAFAALVILFGARQLRSAVEQRLAAKYRLERVEIRTSGTLPRGQVLQLLRLPRGTSLGAIDIHRCRTELLKCPQVRDAHVERAYPNTLRVKILERAPLFKVSQRNSREWLFVSSDGFVFPCSGLKENAIAALPQLHCSLPVVADTTLLFVPQLCKVLQEAKEIGGTTVGTWSAISVDESACGRTGKLEEFEVRCPTVAHLRLRSEDLPKQFEELEYILRDAKERHLLPLDRVDLSIRGRAYVKPLRSSN